jgi:dipeptidyl aminopeptidase/acylaminoacyl peptidase
MYPPGYGKDEPAPLVLEIHGGPHGFHPQVTMLGLYQALAAAGYVVVLPNPRGSHGYGEEFAADCVGDWGGADFEDLMGAVDKLVGTGAVDPKRMYVTGYSYGGFMTSWTIGHTDRFQAACVAAPITDLASMWGTTDIPNFAAQELGGSPWEWPDAYAKRSPITYVADVTTPVQLFHWEGDLRCPIGQSEEYFQALRKLGREVVMVRYPGGFHIMRSPSQMVDYIARHLEWFSGH